MRFVGRCYRGHDPGWSFSPLSGEGAAQTGGRFNAKGEPTLYLALDAMTAIGELTQGFAQRLHPLTLCEYDVDCEGIADLRDATERKRHGVLLESIACGWMGYLLRGEQAPSWLAASDLRAQGCNGVLVPSFAPGASTAQHNLVLWRWGAEPPCRVEVFDPDGRLPQNRLSWLHEDG